MRLLFIRKQISHCRFVYIRPRPYGYNKNGSILLYESFTMIVTILLLTMCLGAIIAKTDSSLIPNKNKNPLSHLRLIVPPSHIALSGDLHIQITGNLTLISPPNLVLDISRQEDDLHVVLLTSIQVLPDARTLNNNVTTIKLPCGIFSKGGPYILHLTLRENDVMNITEEEDIGISKELDVRWPSPRLSLTPEHIQTYPERPVTAILEFPEVICPPVSEKVPTAIPEFWLELHFCGPSLETCDDRRQTTSSANITSTSTTQILYSEQVRGFPGRRVVSLRCELFGLAGYYALVLRPTSTTIPSVTSTAVYLKADWSEQFVFNVHARSIFPCDSLNGGIRVLFQYPACILQTGDRIRLYAKLRADVASLVPPTSLEYVEEKRFTRGQHSLYFDCDLFVERYVEYCFVYVSQALTGAVADVRQDCVPTLPVTESETGGWSEWSEWTPCTTTCAGGTRNRHRFCDSPPPRYGAKFCEGPAVETEKCGNGEGASDWECMYGGGNSVIGDVPADRPEVKAEIGPGCRCGCVVHLGKSKPRRLVATSSQSCPGRTFWLIQADHDHVIRFKVDHFRLPCGSQWLKVRDGSSLSSSLISQLVGTPYNAPPAVISTGPYLLLEFFSDELNGEICGGGFLAHAQQMIHVNSSNVIPIAQGAVLMASIPPTPVKLTTVHVVALIFIFVIFVVSAGLIIQYILRYRKYQIAEDLDSFAEISEKLNLL